jgi:group I intron endonuclease
MSKSGIYQIRNLINGKRYIGSSINLEERWNRHKSLLLINQHHSIKFQRAWNKYGEQNFIFEIIEEVRDKQLLLEREQYWMDFFQSYKNGYNICIKAGNCLGIKRSCKTKNKISKAQMGKKHHSYGKNHSKEHKQKISEAMKGENHHNVKLTLEKVQEIRKKYIPRKYTLKMLAKEYNISICQIGFIINNKSWKINA